MPELTGALRLILTLALVFMAVAATAFVPWAHEPTAVLATPAVPLRADGPLLPPAEGLFTAWAAGTRGTGDPWPTNAPFVNMNVTDLGLGPGDNQNEISLSVDMAGRVFMAWNDCRPDCTAPGVDYRCGMSSSLDRGLTWTPNALYKNPAWNVAGDPVAVSDAAGRTYLVCMPFSRGPNRGEMDVLTSLDGGQTWVNTANIGVSGGSNLDDKPWAAAYGNGTIVVVWDDFPSAAS